MHTVTDGKSAAEATPATAAGDQIRTFDQLSREDVA